MRVKPVPKRRSARSGTIASETCRMPPARPRPAPFRRSKCSRPSPSPCMIGTKLLPLSSRRKSSSRRSSRLFIYDVLFVLACKGTAPVHRVRKVCPRNPLLPVAPFSVQTPRNNRPHYPVTLETSLSTIMSKLPDMKACPNSLPLRRHPPAYRQKMTTGPESHGFRARWALHGCRCAPKRAYLFR